ncbi:hypothetical protein CPB83DRAFT_862249 [Crepidotus variabilis]|uniref:DUF6534 domain-containing protein n=1 Tax=Crepidotus variabilis TaxID=179855 RepID=A0A9P6E786_9AGAR|nr:hypothetical protein CPB83DRAFT_862249 [Crepidotus variabilis]
MDSPPNALPPIPPNIGRIAGPLLVGHLLNWALFGVLSMQIYMYHLAFPNDPPRSKALSYGVYVFEAVQTFILTQTAFHAFADGFGNLLYLDEIGTIWFSVPIMSGIVAFVAQTFYAYRIKVLSDSKIVASFVVLLAVVQLGGAIATGVMSERAKYSSKFLGTDSLITTGIWNGGSALCDTIIAICMTVYLARRNTGMAHTRNLVKKIIRLTVETGSLTAVIALLNFVLALLPGHPTYYMATAGILGKLYSNSMMAVFNSRIQMAEGVNSTTSVELSTGSFSRSRADQQRRGPSNMVSVSVRTEQVHFPEDNQRYFDGREFDTIKV